MKAEFLTLSEKDTLYGKLLKGDKTAIEETINEIERLENIIRDYEMGTELLMSKANSTLYKKPKIYNHGDKPQI